MHGERYRHGDNTGVIKTARMDRRFKRGRYRKRRWREMEGCRETNIMWERHNDSDTEIMKKREGVVHEKSEGEEATRERKRGYQENRQQIPLLSSLLFHSWY